MTMISYLTEIQRQFIDVWGFTKGENGCPQNVPNGAYPMIIDGELDLVLVIHGMISCCNLVATEKGRSDFRKKESERRAKQKIPE